MGYNSRNNLIEYQDKLRTILKPLLKEKGSVDLSNFDKKNDLEYLLALVLNQNLSSSEEKDSRSFGADTISAIQIEITDNEYLKYWGKINWLSKPNAHKCYKEYQDPFYGVFKVKNDQFEIVKGMFGTYDKIDLDGDYWIASEIHWMYDV